MVSFIEQTVEQLLKENYNFSNTVFILPSRRAGRMLERTIASKINKTIFAPTIHSIESFIEKISGLRPVTHTELLLDFYTVYTHLDTSAEKDDFATFLGWGPTLLSDFNEIDRYLIPHKSFFEYIAELQKINQWGAENTPIMKGFLQFWDKLPNYYTGLCDHLKAKNKGHQGLLYRTAVEKLEYYINSTQQKQHVFMGFNALNNAEQTIIQECLAQGNTRVFWDAEQQFYNDKEHEAGLFLRKYSKNWKYYKQHDLEWLQDNFCTPKKINTYPTSSAVTQVKAVAQVLQNINTNTTKCAVVLGDESHLPLILQSLPKEITEVNITMGISLKNTPVYVFFEQLSQLHLNAVNGAYFYKDVETLLTHSFSPLLFDLQHINTFITAIKKSNEVYISHELLKQLQNPSTVDLLFSAWHNSAQNALSCYIEVVNTLRTSFLNETLFLEYLYHFSKVFNQLQLIIDQPNAFKDLKTLLRFYKDIITQETLDLRGNQEKGLQIMGVLESRLLDFDTVIITSVNEGTLPSGKSQNSFIPYELKKAHHLPTFKEKDAIYGYHFYKLLHRAKDIHLFYIEGGTGLNVQEKSRFITQLEVNGPHLVQQINMAAAISLTPKTRVEIEKTPEILAQLRLLGNRYFSPSALTTYIRNPFVYYKKYLLKIKDLDSVEETIAANTMGTIVHDTLEQLYTPYIGVILTAQIMDVLYKKAPAVIISFFEKHYAPIATVKGQNLIIFEVLNRQVLNFIKQEKKEINSGTEIIIKQLEQKLTTPLFIPTLNQNVIIGGTVDRVDTRDGVTHIIDYKTGYVSSKDVTILDWEDLYNTEKPLEKAFQILMYTYILNQNNPLAFPVNAGIISLRAIQNGVILFGQKESKKSRAKSHTLIFNETLAAFEETLIKVISSLFDQDTPFHDSGSAY